MQTFLFEAFFIHVTITSMFTEGIYYRFGTRTFIISLFRHAIIIFVGICILVGASYLPELIGSLPALPGGTTSIGLDSMQPIINTIISYGSILLGVIALFLVLIEWINYESHKFMLDHYALRVRSGWLARSEVAIPYTEIQTVNLNESLIGRMWGVSGMSILTGGSEDRGEESSGSFHAIDNTIARALQEELLRRSSIQEVRTAEDPTKPLT